MVLLMTEEAEEKRIVTEFCHLLEKSKQLFNGLRDLPPYGYKQWQTYFCRTFDVYTKLWKFQQQHRPTLDKIYCLKRWQIGEIASKIGQLYYHYYLRTSELHYLNESAAFYGAIRARGYYNRKDERNEFLIKKLRYLARFILVCLLLRRMKLVKELVHELSEHIEDYSNTPMYEAEDHLEWTFVLGEILSFLQAEAPLTIIIPSSSHHHHQQHSFNANNKNPHDNFDDCGGADDEKDDEDDDGTTGELIFIPTYRLCAASVPSLAALSSSESGSFPSSGSNSANAATSMSGLILQEALLVCTKSDQIKFSDYTIDMYRMLQTLEREPSPTQHLTAATSTSNNSGASGTGGCGGESGSAAGREDGARTTSCAGTIESCVDILEIGEDTQGAGQPPGDLSEDRSSSHTAATNNTNSTTSTSNTTCTTDRASQHGSASGSRHCAGVGGGGGPPGGVGGDKFNPHKHLLYKPSIEQLLVYISSSLKCIGHDGVLLVYISGDTVSPSSVPSTPAAGGAAVLDGVTNVNGEGSSGVVASGVICSTNPFRPRPIVVSPIECSPSPSSSGGGGNLSYESGGISMMMSPILRKESQGNVSSSESNHSKQQQQQVSSVNAAAAVSKCQRKDKQCLYPGDLLPFTRKPLFLIIDSENSHIFAEIVPSSALFTAPVIILMSPMELPAAFQGSQSTGSFFTHFLHSPFSAFTTVCQLSKVTKSKWNAGQEIISRFMLEAGRAFLESLEGNHRTHHSHNPAQSGLEFFNDDFLRVLILRFIFCEIVLRLHKSFQYSTRCCPRSQPNLLNQLKLTTVGKLQAITEELVRLLGVEEFFNLESSTTTNVTTATAAMSAATTAFDAYESI